MNETTMNRGRRYDDDESDLLIENRLDRSFKWTRCIFNREHDPT